MNPTDQWLKGTFCPDDGSGQETGQYVGILHIRPDLKIMYNKLRKRNRHGIQAADRIELQHKHSKGA